MSIELSAHLSMLFTEHPFLERASAARAAGFRHVESWWPRGDEVDAWPDCLRESGVRLALVNAYAGAIQKGDRGFLNEAGRRADALDAVRAAVGLVKRADGSLINVLVGRQRDAARRPSDLRRATEVLAECAELAGAKGVTLLVESLNEADVPGYLVPTPDAAAEMICAIDSPWVRMLYDAYNVAMGGEDPIAAFSSYATIVGHVQYADAPGRGAPGTGRIDLVQLLRRLSACGYSGAVGLEFHPRGPTVASLEPIRPALRG